MEHIDIRALLVQAVDHFLAKTPEDVAEAKRLVEMCRGPRQYVFTLDTMVWGYPRSTLTDSIFYENDEELLHIRTLLTEGSDEVHPSYEKSDYGRFFTEAETLLRTKLVEALEFFDTLTDENAAERMADYDKRLSELQEVFSQTPQSEYSLDETTYHLVLREVMTTVETVGAWWLRRVWYLASDEEMKRQLEKFFASFGDPPDMSPTITWARKALRAISGEDWLYMTWRYKRGVLLFSFH